MFNRFKEAIAKTVQEEPDNTRKRSLDVSFLNPKEIEQYKKTLAEVRTSIEEISQISKTNKEDILEFIKTQKSNKTSAPQKPAEQQEADFTLEEDMEEIKTLLKDVIIQLSKLQQTNEEIKDRVGGSKVEGSSEKMKEMQDLIRKYEAEIKAMHTSEENNKQILTTLRQQTQLLSKETKDLQQKNAKIEKDLAERTLLVQNLREEKNVLLEMRHIESNSTNPEVESLKNQLADADKKLQIEKTKVQQKEKEVDTLKKKLEEDRDSLQKIADQLKEKELKSKKILDKYERSKTEIRKYREEKTQFIKKLNMEIASLTEKMQKLTNENAELADKIKELHVKNEQYQSEISKNQGKGLELQSSRSQLKQLRQEQIETTAKYTELQNENGKLKLFVEQLQSKRKSLLQALEKPINHQIRTLDKIIRALERLYKEYIEIVFEQGNIIGFQTKISYILSNVCQIKEDLKL